tara:strand:+ start:13833 stop:13952 length:120 start_codon:yes stop_codon:yes gene_type:complete
MEESWIIDLKYEHDLTHPEDILSGKERVIFADDDYCAVD